MTDTSFVDLFALPGVQRSAWALLVAGVSLPVVGVLIIGLDVITVRFAVMHTALLGIALGLWWGVPPYGLALGMCAVLGLSLAPLASRPAGLSGPMSFVMTMTAAAALLVLSISGVNANGAFEVLWGSILATRPEDLIVLVVVAVAVLTMFATTRRRLALVLFDRELALCSGVSVVALTALALLVVCVSIGSAIRLTGALLVDSVTILPALAARNIAVLRRHGGARGAVRVGRQRGRFRGRAPVRPATRADARARCGDDHPRDVHASATTCNPGAPLSARTQRGTPL